LLGRFFHCPFFGGWDALQRLLGERLRDWSLQTGVPLGSFDVVLGVMTGGGFLAPLAADLCAESEIGSRRRPTVEYIKVSRYEEDVYTVGAMAGVMIDQLLGQHERQYKVSNPPPRAALEGKRVLIVDDASASGGTLKAAHAHCVGAGATEVHGVALKVISGYWRPDKGIRRPAVALKLPAFTPWGTF
jgi:hypoxanthine phosphoribosyltransferase